MARRICKDRYRFRDLYVAWKDDIRLGCVRVVLCRVYHITDNEKPIRKLKRRSFVIYSRIKTYLDLGGLVELLETKEE